MPAKAGIHDNAQNSAVPLWIPACAGMTRRGVTLSGDIKHEGYEGLQRRYRTKRRNPSFGLTELKFISNVRHLRFVHREDAFDRFYFYNRLLTDDDRPIYRRLLMLMTSGQKTVGSRP